MPDLPDDDLLDLEPTSAGLLSTKSTNTVEHGEMSVPSGSDGSRVEPDLVDLAELWLAFADLPEKLGALDSLGIWLGTEEVLG